MLTYDVKVHTTQVRPDRAKPYRVRWRVGAKPHSKSFRLKGQADGRRSQLTAALGRGEQFDVETGLPVSEIKQAEEREKEQNKVTWHTHSLDYVRMKWPRIAAKHRASIADALATAAPVLVAEGAKGAPRVRVLREALYAWDFRMVRNNEGKLVRRAEVEKPPEAIAEALSWISKHSLSITEVAHPEVVRKALEAISILLNGTPASENTTRRKRMVLSNAFTYAIERGHLEGNPLKKVDWQAPPTDDEVDFRFVPDPKLARALIQGVRDQGARGEHLEAFFGCLYYAAMRPAEIAALNDSDCVLPDENSPEEWGELILAESHPEVASGWTDDGKPYETRGLKRRARKATRPVPIPPVLVRMLREHKKRYGVAPDGRLFRAVRGGRVRSTEYCDLWEASREAVLTPHEFESPLAEVPYSARAAGISMWIKAGVEPPEVARRAGHSLAVLYRVYAKILNGRQRQANQLIDKALEDD